MNFTDLGLSPELLQAVSDAGYSTPTPIQQQAIPYVQMGRDVLGCAQTGTGKTAGFTLPMIDILAAGRAKARMPRSLILEPTRELAAQVATAFETYGKYHKLNMALLIGGEGFSDQERKLDRGVDVLIATPGRLLDMIERGKILLSDVKILVIDEADRMLDMGFIPDVERIVGFLPKLRQTLFFSATMPPEIRRLADAFLSNPKEVTVAPPASPAATVEQALLVVDPMDKRETLRRLLRAEQVKNAIIFCNRKKDVDILHKSLVKHGFDAVALHGDMAQASRTKTLERFKSGEVQLLVASDVAARGLDIQGLSHVFNFDVPIHAEDYVHRIGRTGRAGASGKAFTIAAPEDGRAVQAIVTLIGKDIPMTEADGIATQELVYEDTRRGGRGRGRGGARRGESKRPDANKAEPARRSEAPRQHARRTEAQPVEARQPEQNRAESDRSGDRRSRDRRPDQRRPDHRRQGDVRPKAEPIRMTPEGMERSNVTVLAEAANRRDGRGRQERDDADDRRVVGFGDHLPAFLARPVRLAEGR
ncbi:MAG: DEAD/DEAH box helicase [Alphaproteobacteria bacterium]|nr:DEAD/DEAH box helicase [Alphaproteobacteria bacterium]